MEKRALKRMRGLRIGEDAAVSPAKQRAPRVLRPVKGMSKSTEKALLTYGL